MLSAADSIADVMLRPRARSVVAWTAALIATAAHLVVAWTSYNTAKFRDDPAKARADGNFGHTLIDFGGQWLNARLLVTGHGRELYSRAAQRSVIDDSFPRADQAPNAPVSDADNLHGWLVEAPPREPGGAAIGGALYPPTQALLFAPIGFLSPRIGYRSTQVLVIVVTWLCGLFMNRISGRGVWWPVATLLVFGYPGFQGALHLGQNSALSLAILLGGWLLVVRDRELVAGLVWSLLAFKPTWAVAFMLVPLLTRRWRMLAGMFVGGAALIAATLPFVGLDAWRDWLHVGRTASHFYSLDENWVFLSRDLLNIAHRWLLDFSLPLDERGRFSATLIGWLAWASVLAATVIVAVRRPCTGPVGFGPAFVGLGAWLCCFHFIYYDSLLSLFPVFLLLTNARFELPTFHLRPFVLAVVAFLVVYELAFAWLAIEGTMAFGGLATEGASPPRMLFSTKQHGTPWDTFALLALWAFCGRALVGREFRAGTE